MEKFLQRLNPSKMTQEEIENLNRTVTDKEIKLVIKILHPKKSPESYGFLVISI